MSLTTNPTIVGKNIKIYRELLGVTQSELALGAGLTQPNIASIEAGKTLPKLDRVCRIANVLRIPEEWIYENPFSYSETNDKRDYFELLKLADKVEIHKDGVHVVLDSLYYGDLVNLFNSISRSKLIARDKSAKENEEFALEGMRKYITAKHSSQFSFNEKDVDELTNEYKKQCAVNFIKGRIEQKEAMYSGESQVIMGLE